MKYIQMFSKIINKWPALKILFLPIILVLLQILAKYGQQKYLQSTKK